MKTTKVVLLRQGGRISLPAEFRPRLNIDEHTLLKITLVGRELRIRPIRITAKDKSSAWAHELYGRFVPVRKEMMRYGEKEIDRALAAVRGKQRSRRSLKKG